MNANAEYILKKYQIAPGYRLPIALRVTRHGGLTKLWAELGYKVGAEIGVDRGRFSEEICQANPGVKLYCVDPWATYPGYVDFTEQAKLDRNRAATIRRLKPYGCTVVPRFSLEAAAEFRPNSLDFVYIDANHFLRPVIDDIDAWSKVVRPGGMVAGHDYARSKYPDNPFHVIEAVNAYTAAYAINPWFVLQGDRSASWLWVKP